MTEKTQEEKINDIHSDVFAIKQLLKGYDGEGGLCRQVEKNTKAIFRLTIAIIIIASSVGGGAFGIIRLAVG